MLEANALVTGLIANLLLVVLVAILVRSGRRLRVDHPYIGVNSTSDAGTLSAFAAWLFRHGSEEAGHRPAVDGASQVEGERPAARLLRPGNEVGVRKPPRPKGVRLKQWGRRYPPAPVRFVLGDPSRARTDNQLIKSQLLYH